MSDILLILTIAVFTHGVHRICSQGMIFGWIGDFLYQRLGPFWSKPVTECPPCMSSLWGLVAWVCLGFPVPALHLIVCLPGAAGLAGIVAELLDTDSGRE